MTRKNITSLAIVVVIGLLVQAGFVALDCKDTPADTAVSFARAYYRLSPSMTRWMCGASSAICCKPDCGNNPETCPKAASCDKPVTCPKTASGNEPEICPKTATCNESATCPKAACCKRGANYADSVVQKYLYDAGADVAERGFRKSFAQYSLSHIETRTEYLDDVTALVHLTARRRLSINPVYAYVGRLFRIGDTYEVDESFRVKLEGGRWRVCETSFLSLKTS